MQTLGKPLVENQEGMKPLKTLDRCWMVGFWSAATVPIRTKKTADKLIQSDRFDVDLLMTE